MTGIPGMAVPVFTVVNAGLAMTFLGGGLLLLIALWWTIKAATDRDAAWRWPAPVRLGAMTRWLLWVGGLAVQLLGQFGHGGRGPVVRSRRASSTDAPRSGRFQLDSISAAAVAYLCLLAG